MTLLALTHSQVNEPVVPPQDTWTTTRQISDAMDISTYQAYLILLDLVLFSDRRLNKSLRWYPHANSLMAVGNTLIHQLIHL